MKVILNSDMLYLNSLIRENLHKSVLDFIEICKEHNHQIVIPLTTLMEFENKQKEFWDKEVTDVNQAINKLKSYGQELENIDADALVKMHNLIDLINKTGVIYTVVDPTKEDFEQAHKKACFHEAPCVPDAKSDEMRDLVIWEIALRVAREEKPVLLLSRDKMHIHHRGDIQASQVGLIRMNSFERAIEAFGLETTSSRKIKEMLNKVWSELLESGLPLVKGADVLSIKQPSFVNSEKGTTDVKAQLQFQTGDGKILNTSINMKFIDNTPLSIKFDEIKILDQETHKDFQVDPIKVRFGSKEIIAPYFEERLEDLRELFQ